MVRTISYAYDIPRDFVLNMLSLFTLPMWILFILLYRAIGRVLDVGRAQAHQRALIRLESLRKYTSFNWIALTLSQRHQVEHAFVRENDILTFMLRHHDRRNLCRRFSEILARIRPFFSSEEHSSNLRRWRQRTRGSNNTPKPYCIYMRNYGLNDEIFPQSWLQGVWDKKHLHLWSCVITQFFCNFTSVNQPISFLSRPCYCSLILNVTLSHPFLTLLLKLGSPPRKRRSSIHHVPNSPQHSLLIGRLAHVVIRTDDIELVILHLLVHEVDDLGCVPCTVRFWGVCAGSIAGLCRGKRDIRSASKKETMKERQDDKIRRLTWWQLGRELW